MPHIFTQMARRFGILLFVLAVGACGEQASKSEAAPAGEKIDTAFAMTADGSFTIGADNAPVTMIEYGSFTCPHCAAFHTDVLPKLREKYVDLGLLRFEFRSFARNGADLVASMLVACTGAEKFEAMADLLFANQREWLQSGDPNNYVGTLAKRAGVPSGRYSACVTDPAARNQIMALRQGAIDDHDLQGTPLVIINGKNQDDPSWEALDKMISSLLQ